MRKKYEVSASQPTSQTRNFHTHEVRCRQNGATVVLRFFSERAATFEQKRLQLLGHNAEVKAVRYANA